MCFVVEYLNTAKKGSFIWIYQGCLYLGKANPLSRDILINPRSTRPVSAMRDEFIVMLPTFEVRMSLSLPHIP
jgi:hypothetical protein